MMVLNDILEIIKTGKTPPTKNKEYFDGEISWYTPSDITNKKILSKSKSSITNLAFEENKAVTFNKDTLLVTCIGDIGRVGITPEVCSSNQQITGLLPKENIDVNFLFYWFLHNKQFLELFTNKAVVQILNNASLKKIPFKYCPPLPTQKKIVAILDEADQLRQLDKKLIEKYDALTQSLFLEMFGDPFLNLNNWSFGELSSLITKKPDNGFFAKKKLYNETGTPVVWLTDFIDKLYISTDKLRRAITKPSDNKYLLTYGDALFCRSSLNVEGIGKCAIVPKELTEPIIFECHIIRLTLNVKKVIPEFFRFLTDTKYFRSSVMKNAKTSTMTTISQEGISKINIPIPPIELQTQFAERIQIIESKKALAQQSLQKSEELFNSLLQKAFKGELI